MILIQEDVVLKRYNPCSQEWKTEDYKYVVGNSNANRELQSL